MTPQHPTIRRLDGSIDIDVYRQKGLMERRVVMTDFFRSAGKPLAAAALVLLTLYAVAPRAIAAVDTAEAYTSIAR